MNITLKSELNEEDTNTIHKINEILEMSFV